MKYIILLFENVKDRLDESKKCLTELIPCQAKETDDSLGICIRKEYSSDEEYENIMRIKEKYNLKVACSAFVYFDEFVGRDETYLVIHKDIFPSMVREYDDALTKVRSDINQILLEDFFKGKFQIYPAESISSGKTFECPENRRYEFEMWDGKQERLLHSFIYQKGKVIKTTGNVDHIISVWKEK